MDHTQLENITPGKGKLAMLAEKNYHFIGIGGVGMSGLAKLLIKNNLSVSGSDLSPSELTDSIAALGADINIGHNSQNIPADADAVVISAAVNDSNPELIEAKNRGLKIYKYAQMLGRIFDTYQNAIAVAGTHGKSTTSGWLSFILNVAGLEPTYLIGASISQLNNSSKTGDKNLFVVEACEYDRSFLNFHPSTSIILNIEQDHLDYYSDIEQIISAFKDFAENTRPEGLLIVNGQDKNIAKLINSIDHDVNIQTFGIDADFDYAAKNLKLINGSYSFDLFIKGVFIAPVSINLPGLHNILNALAVSAAAVNAGLDPYQLPQLLPQFTGMDRRLMLKDKINRITVMDDYAHHPTEIAASLSAIRQKYQPKKLFCVFQPHQYSRTRFLLEDFAQSFKLADITILPDIYFVRDSESAKKLVNSRMLADKINQNGSKAVFIDSFQKICEFLKNNVTPDDLVVTMGAGDIWKVADEYIHWLRKNS